MAETRDRDWVDLASKLALPMVLAVFGAFYTWHKDRADDAQKRWDRDSGYVRLLVSSNTQERNLGFLIIADLQKRGQFSADLSPVVTSVAAQLLPSDPNRSTAVQILSTASGASPAKVSASIDAVAAREVYIQIGKEEQMPRALELRDALQKAGFESPEVEVVAHPTFRTYVRYFVSANRDQAARVSGLLKDLKFNPAIQDFTKTGDSGSKALEVWVGVNEPAAATEPRGAGS